MEGGGAPTTLTGLDHTSALESDVVNEADVDEAVINLPPPHTSPPGLRRGNVLPSRLHDVPSVEMAGVLDPTLTPVATHMPLIGDTANFQQVENEVPTQVAFVHPLVPRIDVE